MPSLLPDNHDDGEIERVVPAPRASRVESSCRRSRLRSVRFSPFPILLVCADSAGQHRARTSPTHRPICAQAAPPPLPLISTARTVLHPRPCTLRPARCHQDAWNQYFRCWGPMRLVCSIERRPGEQLHENDAHHNHHDHHDHGGPAARRPILAPTPSLPA
ncbi:hypothetical protein P171DRAFT_30117 [Karstenula rhodostoma CBS 690.94]|uniref:Uncharacterized protein n=1 Tax=Karstenula rhodostoma CBS 690.94 TaxID=1392251 RepID=A0A9P4PHW1_9PLEO|nr:hypothetical protein P171DRAFT_30117 [Karstenula rhodostoma CBS 690.94]